MQRFKKEFHSIRRGESVTCHFRDCPCDRSKGGKFAAHLTIDQQNAQTDWEQSAEGQAQAVIIRERMAREKAASRRGWEAEQAARQPACEYAQAIAKHKETKRQGRRWYGR